MAKRLSVAPKKKNNKQHPFWIVGLAIFVFLLVSGSVVAQTWNPPSTEPPGTKTPDVASNISGLIRLAPTGTTGQFKAGSLAIGTSTIANIVQRFEVYGDTKVDNSFLIGTGNTVDMATYQLPCTTAGSAVSTPVFYARSGDNVYIGGSNFISCAAAAKLTVASGDNEFPDGAIYATGALKHGVWGYSSDSSASGSGIKAQVGSSGAVAVYGDAINAQNTGLFAQATGTSLAALFKGNVTVEGGYLQGNGSGLYRVGSLYDASLPLNGGQGMSVWAKRDVSVPNGTSSVDLGLATGELVRTYSALVRSGATYQMYTPPAFPDLQILLNGSQIQLTNSSGSTYTLRLLVHVQSGASIVVDTYYPGAAAPKSAGDDIPVVFDAGKTIELESSVPNAADRTFKWSFVGTAAGQLCVSGTTTCTSGATEITSTNQRVTYQMPATTTQLSATLKVEWTNDPRDPNVSRQFRIDMVDIQKQVQNQAIEYDAADVNVPFNVQIASDANPSLNLSVLKFTLKDVAQGTEKIDANTGRYTAPSQALNAGLVNRHITVALAAEPLANKVFSVYLVPKVTLSTTFPSGPQAGQATSTVARGTLANPFPLNLNVSLAGEPGSGNLLQCNAGVGTCTNTSSPFSLSYTSIASIGQQTITATWVPNNSLIGSTAYPTGFTYAKTTTVTVGSLSVSGPTSGASGTFTFTTSGYASAYLATTLPANQVNSGTWSGTGNQQVGGSVASTITQIVTSGTNQTRITFSTGTAGTYTIYGRSINDLRDVKSASITYTSGGGCVCAKGNEICCVNINTEDPQT